MPTTTSSDSRKSADQAATIADPAALYEVLDEVFAEMPHREEPITSTPPLVVKQSKPIAPRPTEVAYQPQPQTRLSADDDGDWSYYVKQAICGGLVLLGVVLFYCGMPAAWQAAINPFAHSTVADATPALHSASETKPIEEIRVGDRIVGRNPIREQADLVEPDPATWRTISLHLTKESGLGMWVDLLRHESWIAEHDIRVGNFVFIDLFELGIEGDAEVTYVGPCPSIQPGKGTVVTGTFKHQAEPGTKVVHLRLEDQREPTGVTDNHPYWSVDRREFVAVGDLRTGELVDTEYGLKHVISVVPIKDADYLHNLETTEHVFRVGSLGTLVHNSCVLARKFNGPIHHLASDKDALFSPLFKALFDKAGLSLQSPWNRMRLEGHVGPHGKFYNQLIFNRLRDSVAGKTGGAYRTALIDELKSIRRDIRYNGWDALLKAPASRVDVIGEF